MNCRYCGASNTEEEHRCVRCGRRIQEAAALPGSDLYPVDRGHALAAQPALAVVGQPEREAQFRRRGSYQAALFSTREIGRVVPIQSYTGSEQKPAARAKKLEVAAGISGAGGMKQESFAFQAAGTARARHRGQEAVRYCNAPVATPIHRGIAAAADYSVVAISVATVAVMLYMKEGAALVNAGSLPYFGALGLFLAFAYKFMWAAAGTDSPGLHWAQLELLNFDGMQPTRRQRVERMFGGSLSVLAGGLGLIWALADEETLSWHDHMSKTFLTVRSRNKRKR
ncbi:MAG: RDD family protein [Acidobacteriia bacterium]|nr:RDD family protein [Terriglobia bacterium]